MLDCSTRLRSQAQESIPPDSYPESFEAAHLDSAQSRDGRCGTLRRRVDGHIASPNKQFTKDNTAAPSRRHPRIKYLTRVVSGTPHLLSALPLKSGNIFLSGVETVLLLRALSTAKATKGVSLGHSQDVE